MNKETAELMVRTVQQHYGEHPNFNTEMRIERIDGEWMVTTAFETYYRVPFRMPLTARPCRCTARYCASGKVAPALLDTIRPHDPRAGLCIGDDNTCPNPAECSAEDEYGRCTRHRKIPARLREMLTG
jgi:hypothetical protein